MIQNQNDNLRGLVRGGYIGTTLLALYGKWTKRPLRTVTDCLEFSDRGSRCQTLGMITSTQSLPNQIQEIREGPPSTPGLLDLLL